MVDCNNTRLLDDDMVIYLSESNKIYYEKVKYFPSRSLYVYNNNTGWNLYCNGSNNICRVDSIDSVDAIIFILQHSGGFKCITMILMVTNY